MTRAVPSRPGPDRGGAEFIVLGGRPVPIRGILGTHGAGSFRPLGHSRAHPVVIRPAPGVHCRAVGATSPTPQEVEPDEAIRFCEVGL